MLKDLFLKPDIDKGMVEVLFTCPTQFHHCSIKIFDNKQLKQRVEAMLISGRENCVEVGMSDFILWNINNPHLYDFEMTLIGDKETFVVNDRFGMRKIEARGKWIYVNNEKFYVRGYIRGRDAHEHPNLTGLNKKEYYVKNIKIAKDYGFNLIRFHSRIPEKECLQAADELGIFIHIELRKCSDGEGEECSGMDDEGEIFDRHQWINTILSLRNHPSVMVYCMGNEIRHPGTNSYISEIAALTKKIDPTRLFIDTCAHGEFDRTYVDFDVQHMGYYYPFGSNYNMFDHTYNWNIFGSSKGHDVVKRGSDFQITRTIKPQVPVLAHEICHYVGQRNIEELELKFAKYCPDKKPWWLDELKKLIEKKGLKKDWQKIYEASAKFQQIGWKLGIEAVRRSRLLAGFHFLQLSDTDKYENANGIIDCFDDPKHIKAHEFAVFNSDAVVLADLPVRTYFEKQKVTVPVLLSNFDNNISGTGRVSFQLKEKKTSKNIVTGDIDHIELCTGLEELCRIEFYMPAAEYALELELIISISCGNKLLTNSWSLWLYPNRPENIPAQNIVFRMEQINIPARYPQLKNEKSGNLMITNRFSDELFEHLKSGKNAMVLYRVPETRGRINPAAPKEKYHLPATWDRFKGVIWDRGTNCGAFIRNTKALNNFPNDGFVDLQFYHLIDDSDKISLDDFPVAVDPIIQGVDKANRDRFDVITYKLSEFQPEWMMRKFAYLFELKVENSKLLICGFNFTGINKGDPASCAMFESLLSYVNSTNFNPQAEIGLDSLKSYLIQKSIQPRIKERKMTQFWQMDLAPLESDIYWKTAEKWIETDQFEGKFVSEIKLDAFYRTEEKENY